MTISLSGEGVRFTVERGVAAGTRSDGVTTDPVAATITATDGLHVAETMSVRNLELTGEGGRGGSAEGALIVDVGRPEPQERRVVLVEEDGRYSWALPAPGEEHVRLEVESGPGSRGLVKRARAVVRVLAVRTVGWAVHKATGTIVGGWDERRHPHRLRDWTPEDHRDPNAPAPEPRALAAGPALLVIHGFTGSIHGSFGDLAPEVVAGFHRAYGGRTFAFDHPTLAVSPRHNAEWLVEQLSGAGVPLVVDVLAHSRGGLVAREVAQRLTGTGLTVRSITFVATPNDGTPLADPHRPDGLLDALTNLTAAIPGSGAVALALELLKDIVTGSVLTALDGMVAMNPNGAYLKELNELPIPEGLALRAITADFEPRSDAGVVRTARDRLTDLYFGGLRNDLIVPTLSTVVTSGAFGVRAGHRLVLDSSRGVDHSSFWTNPRAVGQLVDWVRPDWPERPPAPVPDAETDPSAEVAELPEPRSIDDLADAVGQLSKKARAAVEGLVGGPISAGARRPTGNRPAVIVIPGIMGTHLRRRSGELIWVDPVRLMRGHFADLSLVPPANGIEPAGMHRTYLPLVSRLAEAWDVYLAPFDWRLDIRDSANKLANLIQDEVLVGNPTRAVHLVAHSMGGLVARALTFVAPEVWSELGAEHRGDSGRLVMLGTPNRGSFAIVLTLTGSETVVKALAAVDRRNDTRRLTEVVATFPGVYQMLPALTADPIDDQHAELFVAGTWGRRSPVDQALLSEAAVFHRALEETHQKLSERDLARMISVAGYGHPTPYRLEIGEPGSLSLGRVVRGDGRVAMPLNHLDGVTRFYCRASHGALPAAPEVLDSLRELLAGRPGTLELAEPEFRGAEAIERPAMIPVELFDPAPTGRTRGTAAAAVDRHQAEARLTEALRASLGGGVAAPERVQVKIQVVHASLEQARFPVAVGHYTGVPIAGAEAFLDHKLGGVLRQRQALGQYPDRAGSAVYVPAPAGHRPHGALVLGLGEFGSLTGATLAEAVAQAVIVLVLDERARSGDPAAPVSVGLSSVLVGTPGRHDLTIEDAVTSIVEGVIEGVTRLRRQDESLPLESVELELIEVYQQPAEEAALLLGRLSDGLEPSLRDQVDLLPFDRLTTGDGHRPGAPPGGGSGEAWVRVLVGLEPDRQPAGSSSGIRRLTFATLARGAQANRIEHDVNLDKIRAYVDSAVRHPDQDPAVSRTLYELLFPPRAKLDLDRSEHLHLIVDEDTAQFPWELLAAATSGRDVAPLALRAGMLRQLQSTTLTRPRTSSPRGMAALFIGDPPTSYPRIPNAREEAERLASLFVDRGWEVERRIYGEASTGEANEWMDILNALHQRDYRVVHIAAHGVFDEDWRRSGVALGPLPEHRLTALEFEAMSNTPDLVFLNCCHLGRLGWLLDADDSDTRALERPHRVAGTVAQQLLRNGVRAVVVAGWAVDDFAAAAFASELYQAMLDGYPLGKAVRRARLAAHAADDGRSNTWGAYQCYGDPDFEMVTRDVPSALPPRLVSTTQLAREFGLAAIRASAATSTQHCEQVAQEVNQLRAAGGDLVNDGGVLEALGGAFSELGRYPEAVDAYQQALGEERGEARLRTVEQLANLKVRLAVSTARAPGGSPDGARRLFAEAASTLDLLDHLAGSTAERHALRGSLHKKRATTLGGAERTDALVAAREAYLTARRISSPEHRERLDPYHTNLWLQLVVLTSESGTLTDEDAVWLEALQRQVVVDADSQAGYWEGAAVADTLLTHVVAGRCPEGPRAAFAAVEEGYGKAFALRSTVRQRDSVLTHLQDLSLLVPAEQAPGYVSLFASLQKISSADDR